MFPQSSVRREQSGFGQETEDGMMLAPSIHRRLTVDSQTLMIIGVGVVVLLLALAAWFYTSRRQRVNLRERFGPEYERTVEAVGAERADSVLQERAERVSRFNLHKLTHEQASAFAREWSPHVRHRQPQRFVRTRVRNVRAG